MVTKETINKKLRDNNYDIRVASKEPKFNYDNGNGEVPLKCTNDKDNSHILKNKGKLSFNKLEDYFRKNTEICNTCATNKNVATTGTSNSEIEFKNALQEFITGKLGCNVTIYSGANKAKTEYKSQSGKRRLDYDIKITDNDDNTKTFTISILGPSHNAFNPDVNRNDAIRAVNEYGNSFIISPAFRKGTKLFEDKLKSMKDYIRILYNKHTYPEEGKKARKLERRFGKDSIEYKTHVEEKSRRIEQRLKNIENSAVQHQLTNILTALRTNVGINNTTYKGKYNNLINYINNEGDKVIKSYLLHKDEWNKLLTVNKKEFDDWVERNQARSEREKNNYAQVTSKGNPKNNKLFEHKNPTR